MHDPQNPYFWEILLFFLGTIIVVVAVLIAAKRKPLGCQLLEEQAKKRNGRFQEGISTTPSEYCRLLFDIQGIEVCVSLIPYEQYTPYKSHFQFEVSLAQVFNFKIYRKSRLNKFGKLLGIRYVQAGNPNFDNQFMIECRHEDFIHRFLTTDLQSKLIEIYLYRCPRITFKNRIFCFSIDGIPSDPYDMDQFLETGIIQLRRLLELRDTFIP